MFRPGRTHERASNSDKYSNAVKAEGFVRNKTNFRWHGLLRCHNIHMDHGVVRVLRRMRFANQCKARGTWHSLRAALPAVSFMMLPGTCTLCIFLGVKRYT